MNSQEVIDSIEEAFKNTTLDGGCGLWQAHCADNYERDEDVIADAKEFDEKTDWHKLDPKDLRKCESSLSFFGAKGMRFHLPAFIIAEIKGELECGCIFHLTDLSEYGKRQLSLLNAKQKKAIMNFLEWCLTQDMYQNSVPQIKQSIDNYWKL